jgi:hypothetical protein
MPAFITDSSDDADGNGSNDARRTNNKAYSSTPYSTAGNSGTGNSNRMGNTRSTPARTQPKSTLAHRNAGLKQRPIRPPPVQLREVSSLFYLPVIKQKMKGKVFRFIRKDEPPDIP